MFSVELDVCFVPIADVFTRLVLIRFVPGTAVWQVGGMGTPLYFATR